MILFNKALMIIYLRYIILFIIFFYSLSLHSLNPEIPEKSASENTVNQKTEHVASSGEFAEESVLSEVKDLCTASKKEDETKLNVDSVIDLITKYSKAYVRAIDGFEGEVYVKGNTEIIQSNFLFWMVPDLFPFSKKEECSVFEILNKINYTAPDNYTITPIAVNSSINNAFTLQEDITSLLDINIYKKSNGENKYIIPGNSDAVNKYIYKHIGDTVINKAGCHIIKYTPVFKHLKLVEGELYVNKLHPVVAAINTKGKLNFSNFELYIEFGSNIRTVMLPQKSIIKLKYNIVNNRSEYTYHCTYLYDKIDMAYNLSLPFNKSSLDKTIKYNKDSVRHISDDKFWIYYREKPLSYDEVCLIEDKRISDSLHVNKADSVPFLSNKRIQDFIINNTTLKKEKFQWKYHGILNPALVGYSPTNGVVFRQRISYTRYFNNGTLIDIKPEVGYAIKSKELFYGINNNFLFHPKRMGMFSINFRSGNKGFNSKFINEVNHRLDSTKYDFKDLDIDYYRDFQFEAKVSREMFNGMIFNIGAEYNIHVPEKNISVSKGEEKPLVGKNYADFIPFVRLTFIPFQPYRFIGKRKEYLDTKSPIFSIEYARGIKGVMNSNSSFDRFEVDMHQKIPLFNLSFLSYRIGLGRFMNQEDEYFVRFNNFQRSNYPSTWNDNMGGVFNILDSKWYYSSPEYMQIHVMYDTPFFLFYRFRFLSKLVLSERIYFSQLFSSSKPSYTEVGYGVGNYIFNIAAFVSFHKYSYTGIGVKFTYELDKYW